MANPEERSPVSIGGLASQVRDFWNATGIPIVELMLAVLVLSWCAVGATRVAHSVSAASVAITKPIWLQESALSARSSASSTANTTSQNVELDKGPKSVIETYGLSTILPIATLIALLGIAQGLSAFMRMLGGNLPIHFAYNVETLILRYLPLSILESAWARLDSVKDPRLLSERLDQEVNWSADNNVARGFFRGSLDLQPVVAQLDSTRRFVAGLLAAGLLVWLLHLLLSLGAMSVADFGQECVRLVILLAAGAAALSYLNLNFLRAARLYHYRKFADYVAWKDDALNGPPPEASLTAAEYRIEQFVAALPKHSRLVTRVTRNTDLEFDMLAFRNKKNENPEGRINAVKERLEELRRRSENAKPPMDTQRSRY